MDSRTIALLVFIFVTALRQMHYFWHQSKQKKLHRVDQALRKEDQLGSHLLYILYAVIWFGTVYELYTSDFNWVWYAIGLFLVVAGFILRVIALRDLGKSYGHEVVIWPGHQLVTYGVYSWIRHPLYLALAVELLGMVIAGREIWLLVAWLLVIVVLARRVSIEDKELVVLGEPTRKYQMTIPAVNIFVWFFRREGKR